MTLGEVMLDYFSHPEWKAEDPKGIGELWRQHVAVLDQAFIGKETNEVLADIEEESSEVLTYPDAERYGERRVVEILKSYTDQELLDMTGIPRQTLGNLRRGVLPSARTRAKLAERPRSAEAGNESSEP